MRVESQTPVSSAQAVDDYAEGMTDRAVATLNLPRDLTHYLLGVDVHWGQNLSFFANIGMNYASWWDPAVRLAHVMNGFVLGAANFVTAGGLRDDLDCLREGLTMAGVPYANDALGAMVSVMPPSPHTAYDAGGWTLDTVVAVAGTRIGIEYHAWRRPISHRAAIMADALEASLPRLREAASTLPDLMAKGADAQLAEGSRAMEALHELTPHYPQIASWLKDPTLATQLGDQLLSGHVGVVASLKLRLSILYRYNPEAVISAIQESVLQEWRVREGQDTGRLVEHAATPHFDLLRRWEGDVAMRPLIAKAYATIALNTELLPVTMNAGEGLLRLGAEAEHYAAALLGDPRPMVKYAMMRAALTSGRALPAEMAAQLRDIPVMDHLILLGREKGTAPVRQILTGLAESGNEHVLRAMELMVETAHPYAHQALAVMRRLRESQIDLAGRISRFLRQADVNVVENDVIFCVGDRDVALAVDNAQVLVELVREGNAGAMAAVRRLSEHTTPAVREIGAQCLVDMTLEGTLPQSQMTPMLMERHPRLLPMVEYWTVKDPVSLKLDLEVYGDVVQMAPEFPDGTVHVLEVQARLGNAAVGGVVSRLLYTFPEQARDLVQVLHDHPAARQTVDWKRLQTLAESSLTEVEFPLSVVRLMSEEVAAQSALKNYDPRWFFGACNSGESAGVAGLELLAMQGNVPAVEHLIQLSRRKADPSSYVNIPYLARHALKNLPKDTAQVASPRQPTMAAMLTDLDLHAGRAALLAKEILSGKRLVRSVADLNILRQGVEKKVSGALDAIYKVAWEGGEFSAEARDLLLQWDQSRDVSHTKTIGVMLRVLANRHSASPVNHAAAPVSHGQSLRYLETLITVSRDHAPLALDELMREVQRHPDAAKVSVLRLMDSSNPRVVDLVSDRLVQAAESGDIHITFLRLILQMDQSHAARLALSSRLRFHLDTALRSTPLEGLRALL